MVSPAGRYVHCLWNALTVFLVRQGALKPSVGAFTPFHKIPTGVPIIDVQLETISDQTFAVPAKPILIVPTKCGKSPHDHVDDRYRVT